MKSTIINTILLSVSIAILATKVNAQGFSTGTPPPLMPTYSSGTNVTSFNRIHKIKYSRAILNQAESLRVRLSEANKKAKS